jgi:hypothetical protein
MEPLGHVDTFDCRGYWWRLEERLDCLTICLVMVRSAVKHDCFRVCKYLKEPEAGRTAGASVKVEAQATGFRAGGRDSRAQYRFDIGFVALLGNEGSEDSDRGVRAVQWTGFQ